MAAMQLQPQFQKILKLHLFNLAKVQQTLHQPARAIRTTRELAALAHDPSELYRVACAVALCVPLTRGDEQQAIADEAIRTLRQAVAAGWTNAQRTSRDPDLAALHGRDDFCGLVATLFDRSFPAAALAP